MSAYPLPSAPHGTRGLTLLELVLALALAALLILGLVQMASAASGAGRLQRNQAQLQDRARFALGLLARAVREAGYRPEPWAPATPIAALTDDNAAAVRTHGDRLGMRTNSDRNCFGNRNPDTDAAGRPRFYLRETVFDLNSGKGLTRLCRYGPSATEMTTQIRRQGLIEGVEAFQVRYGEDGDGDGYVDRWVAAGGWEDSDNVLGIRIGLLLASDDAVVEPASAVFSVLDDAVGKRADGRLRRVFEAAAAIRGRTR